jgi:hypothetical protein
MGGVSFGKIYRDTPTFADIFNIYITVQTAGSVVAGDSPTENVI